jgi:hypothetical protein
MTRRGDQNEWNLLTSTSYMSETRDLCCDSPVDGKSCRAVCNSVATRKFRKPSAILEPMYRRFDSASSLGPVPIRCCHVLPEQRPNSGHRGLFPVGRIRLKTVPTIGCINGCAPWIKLARASRIMWRHSSELTCCSSSSFGGIPPGKQAQTPPKPIITRTDMG